MNGNGNPENGWGGAARRTRVDASLSAAGQIARRFSGPFDAEGAGGASGRLIVTLAVLGVLVLWGSLYVAFRQWKSHYKERAAFGLRYVAPAIDPLAKVVPARELDPPGRAAGVAGASALAAVVLPTDESPEEWRAAVADTHAFLVTLTGSNLLDIDDMRELADEIKARVARARPETARAELSAVWDDLETHATPIISDHHPRPRILPPLQLREKRWQTSL